MKKVLITGAAGFLGSECVKRFREAGYDVISTDKNGNVDIVGDLSDGLFVASLPTADIFVNCAAVQYVTKDMPLFFRKKFFEKNNIIVAENLSKHLSSETHLIHVGTSMMYIQDGSEHIEHVSKMLGDGVYSHSKYLAQQSINLVKGSATVIPCIIGGKGREGLFRPFVKMLNTFGCVVFPGDGDHPIHMVHVYDVANLILKIAETQSSGFFNAASPNPLSIRGWVQEIVIALGLFNVKVITLPLPPFFFLSKLFGYRLLAREQLLMLQNKHVLSTERALSIGWKPLYNNAQIAKDIALELVNPNSK